MIQWPLPWPSRVEDIPELADVVAKATLEAIRVQLLAPSTAEAPRAVLYRRVSLENKWLGQFAAIADLTSDGNLPDLAYRLMTAASGRRERPTLGDVLVCGHGRRDRCCGSRGTSLATRLEENSAADGLDGQVRVWRTSHLGGHRFAPTVLHLPTGSMWAFADSELVRRVALRSGSVSSLLDRFRGSAGIGQAGVQHLERIALAELGWEWFDLPRRVEEPEPGEVRVSVRDRAGVVHWWQAEVRSTGVMMVPECGQVLGAKAKTEPTIELGRVRRG